MATFSSVTIQTLLETLKAPKARRHSALFSSGMTAENQHQLLFTQPVKCYQAWLHAEGLIDLHGNIFSIEDFVATAERFAETHGYALAGYFSYEANHPNVGIRSNKAPIAAIPDVQINLYANHQRLALAFSSAPVVLPSFALTRAFAPTESRADYCSALHHVNDYIRAGDCYQINYAQHFSANFSGEVLSAFFSLMQRFNAPYGSYFDTGYGQIVSLSPEQFLKVEKEGLVTTQPIKGSAPRDHNSRQDQINALSLQNSQKNQAENVMIVDLLRNDLGKICTTGSIQTPSLFELQSFTNVHHLVSTVQGQLKDGVSPLQAMLSCFPGGSITGAPKKRAMEIIEELEKVKRSAYCGSAFYQLPNGEFDSSIMIRTLVASENQLHCWGGGGIVADSKAAEEYQESLFKVAPFMRHLETMR